MRSHASVPRQLAGEGSDPLVPKETTKAIMKMQRDAEVIDLFKDFRLKARFMRDNWKGSVWSVAV